MPAPARPQQAPKTTPAPALPQQAPQTPREVGVVLVHGIGEQRPGFAAQAARRLRRGARTYRVRAIPTECVWAPLLDKYERVFLAHIKHQGASGNMAQRFAVGTLADAELYQSDDILRAATRRLLDEAVARVRVSPLMFVTHSLGALVVTDYLRLRPALRNVKLITMGCNLELFGLTTNFDCPRQLRAFGKWVNLFDKDDALGFPLNTGADPGYARVLDAAVALKGDSWWGRLTRGTGLVHTQYWGDRELFSRTIPSLL